MNGRSSFAATLEDDVVLHGRRLSVAPDATEPEEREDPDPGGEDHRDLAERVVPPVAREYPRSRRSGTPASTGPLLEVPRHDVQIGGCFRRGEWWPIRRRPDEKEHESGGNRERDQAQTGTGPLSGVRSRKRREHQDRSIFRPRPPPR